MITLRIYPIDKVQEPSRVVAVAGLADEERLIAAGRLMPADWGAAAAVAQGTEPPVEGPGVKSWGWWVAIAASFLVGVVSSWRWGPVREVRVPVEVRVPMLAQITTPV